jgi:hypothetical protein
MQVDGRIDRGPDSRGVIEYLMALQQAEPDFVTCLMGNHEDMLLAAADDRLPHKAHICIDRGIQLSTR